MKLWQYRLSGITAGLVVGSILVLGLTSCDSQAGPVSAEAEVFKTAAQLNVTHDATNSVTCWSRYGYPATLTCLPDWMLTPAERRPVMLQPCTVAQNAEPCIDGNGEVWPGNEVRRP